MPTLEFALDPADLPRLLAQPGLRAARSFPVTLTWHDTPDAALWAEGLAVSVVAGLWRLAPLRPETASTASTADPTHARARSPVQLLLPNTAPVTQLAQQARLVGRRRALRWTGGAHPVALQLLDGRLDGNAAATRLTLDGHPAAITTLAQTLAQQAGLHVPRASLAAEALAAAHGRSPAARALGAPQVPQSQTVEASLATIISHLLDVLLHWGHLIPAATTPDPVHQMRVAIRRLRSALAIFRKPVPTPELDSLAAPLRLCAARLGAARDWDVFLGGLGARLTAAFPGDKRCRAMIRAATERRRAAYAEVAAFLAGPDFRALTVALSCAATLRPWQATAAAEILQQDTAVFATAVLAHRAKRVRHAGRGFGTLTVPALHELRKDCKRLRYAAEFFAPLFPPKRTRRYVAALSDLQEELGLLNDTAAVSGLMAQLGRLERSYAAGLVEGFSAAHAGSARSRIERAWKRFRAAQPFWPT